MSGDLLQTKLYVPRLRPFLVPRSQLIDKLNQELPDAFTLISAPAGSGKTTLLSQFVARLRLVAWLSLDETDNDSNRFWAYLIAACQSALEGIGESALALLNAPQPLPVDTIPTLLINDLAGQKQMLTLILDDYHVIQNPAIHESVLFLLDYLPENLHVVIATRVDPPWPLARYRVRNRLVEIRMRDLRFNLEEAAAFLNQTMGLNLSTEDVAALEMRTEGWIAGLQLAAIAIQSPQQGSDTSAFVQAFTGSHFYVAEYLVEEILQHQPQNVQTFLLHTSILERLNAGLCNAVTGREDGQATLMALHRANLFITPLDNEGHWFRYHHLFADLLHARLRQQQPPQEIIALQLRAVDWYERNGYEAAAIRHALAAQDFERAAVLIDHAGQSMIFTDHNQLQDWLNALPEEIRQTHARLEIYRVLIDLSQGKLDMLERTLREKEHLIKSLPSSPVNDRLRLEALVYLSLFLAHQNTARAIEMAQETLLELPQDNLKLRAFLYSALYRAYGMAGDIDQSAPAYEECFRLAQASNQIGMLSVTTMVRAFDLCQYGRLDEAAHYCREIIDAGARPERKLTYQAGPSHIGLAGIYLERNELTAAEEHLTRGLELCRQSGMDGLYTGILQKARLFQAKGELPQALAELQHLEQAFQRWDFTLTARQVSVRLALGDIAGASRLTAPLLAIFSDRAYAQKLPLIAVEAFKLCLARIYIAQVNIAQANQLLDEIENTAVSAQRNGRLLEVYLLRALARQKQDDGLITASALAHLARALELADPAGFVLLFLEEGSALIPLLTAVTHHSTASAQTQTYARKLLNAFTRGSQPVMLPAASEPDVLVEPLTPREIEVLELVIGGDSNQAIADKLFITVRTVKKHITSILGKLGASNRTQAAARARELGLLRPD